MIKCVNCCRDEYEYERQFPATIYEGIACNMCGKLMDELAINIANVSKQDVNMLVLCAFRYCIGRRTYVVSTFRDIIFAPTVFKVLTTNTKTIIIKEIAQADDLGDECDVKTWQEIKKVIEESFNK